MTRPLAGWAGGRAPVVTGQQAGLFGGPMYTLVKLLGAVALGRAEGTPVVFWIEGDDADIAEADRATVLDRDLAPRTFSLGEPDDGRPVAARTVGAAVGQVLDDLEAALAPSAPAAAAVAALRRAWAPGKPWLEAFRADLEGLVPGLDVRFLDPTAAAVKRLAAPVFARVLAEAEAVEEALEQGAKLSPRPQVPYLPGELPLFVVDADGRRRKLLRREGAFALKGTATALGLGEIGALLEREPERFSPGVLLRPLVQDYLLGTRAYVAGPAEAAYHSQLGPLYDLFRIDRPRVVPRPRLVVVDARARRALDRLGATLDEALAGETALLARLVGRRAGLDPKAEADRAEASARAWLEPLKQALLPVEPGAMAKAFSDLESSLAHHLGKVAARAGRELERRDQDLLAQVRKLSRLLAPDGVPQDRVYAPTHFLARHGREAVVDGILAAIDPADLGRRLVLELD